MTRVSPNQRKVLLMLAQIYDHDANVYFMRYIAKVTGLEYRVVRLACRALKRKGLVEYVRGLFNDDGEVAGSGYCATRAGYDFIKDDAEFKKDEDEY